MFENLTIYTFYYFDNMKYNKFRLQKFTVNVILKKCKSELYSIYNKRYFDQRVYLILEKVPEITKLF